MTTHDLASPRKRSGTKSAPGNAWRSSALVISRTSVTSCLARTGSVHGPRWPQRHLRISLTRTSVGSHCHPGTRK